MPRKKTKYRTVTYHLPAIHASLFWGFVIGCIVTALVMHNVC
jgi:tetrahydromethanopterin S-methyltransferase subunit B